MKRFFHLINFSLVFLVLSNYKSLAGSNVQFFSGAKLLTLCKGITPKDLRIQLINFIELNPQTINFGGESVVAKSLELNFKCKK